MGDSIQMTLDEKLKQFKDMGNPAIDFLLAALRKCREQRRENALGWEQFDYEFEANWSEEKDDAELLALLQGGGE